MAWWSPCCLALPASGTDLCVESALARLQGCRMETPTAGRRHWHGDGSPREQRPSVILRAYFAGGQTDGLKDRRSDLQCPFRRSHRRTACPAQPPLARLRHAWTRSWLSPEVAWGRGQLPLQHQPGLFSGTWSHPC